MFSVEDLLISHGYQPPKKSSKDKPPSSDENTYTSCQYEVRENPSSHRTVNGYETDTGAYSTSRQARVEGYYSDSEGRERSARRQPGVSCYADAQNLPTFATEEAGLTSGPPLPCSSRPKSGKDVTYWRRRGQDFSVLLDYTNRGDTGYKGNNVTKTQNIPTVEQRGKSSQDAQPKNMQLKSEVVRINEQKLWMSEGQSVTVKEMCEDKWRTAVDRKCQSLGTEEWKASLGRQLSDGDGNRLRHGVLPHVVSDEALKRDGLPHMKKEKSQSLPRVIPESNGKEFQTGLHYVNMSGFDRNRLENQCLKNDLSLQDNGSYCNPKTSSKLTDNFRQSAQLPKAKLTRPLKPPSYELYQQIRKSSEMLPNLHIHGETDGQIAYFAKDSEPSADHNCCPQAPASSSLEPPVYVPPPSYKAPPQPKVGQKCFDKVPTRNNTGQPYQSTETLIDRSQWGLENQESNQAHQKHMSHDIGTKQHLQTKNVNNDLDKDVTHARETYSSSHNGYTDDQKAFVKYIPFDDPRLRHITIVQSEKQYTDADNKYKPWNAKDHVTDVNKTIGPSDHCSAFSVPSGSYYSTQAGLRPIANAANSNRWFVASKPESENGTESEHCCKPYVADQCESSFKYNSRVIPTTNHPVDFPYSSANSKAELHVNQGTVETMTQVKKWEPDSQIFEVQEKKRPKRRMTETIFCLVSVPVKTCEEGSNEDAFINDMGNENIERVMNDSTGNLTEQSFLSMSSSDLELQALTGNMISESGLKRPEPWNEVSSRRAVGYNFNQHRELRASGSWPGDQYRDQETQTSFIKGSRTTRSFTGAMKKAGTGIQMQSPNYSTPESSVLTEGGKRSAEVTTISDEKHKLNNYSIHGQTSLYPSTNSAFSRTAPKQYQVNHINSHQSQLHGVSKSSRERGTDGSAEDQIEERQGCAQTSLNNSKTAVGFGQFLLKPVNRRPWDAISELESFNKEIQEQEDRNIPELQEGNEDDTPTAVQSTSSDKDLSISPITYQKPELCASEKPSAKLTTPKVKEDDGSDKNCSGYMNITPGVQDISKRSVDNNKLSSQSNNLFHKPNNKRTSDTKSSTILNVFTTNHAQFTKLKNEKNVESTNIKRQCININGVRTPMYQLSKKKMQSTNDAGTSISAMAPGKKPVPTLETDCDGSIGKMFSQFDNDQDYLESDLSSLICQKSTKPNTDNLNDLFEQKTAEGISKNESLEERAARILGIDVAVEALISPAKKMLQQGTRKNEAKSPAEVELGYTWDHLIADRENASEEQPGHVKEKPSDFNKLSEWKHNPLYGIPNGNTVLDKLPRYAADSNSELGKRAIINEFFHGPLKEFYNWADKNCCLSIERKTDPGADGKDGNTSETIETSLGKIGSSPNRTALDRLARMKEVDSVSHIRRLSIKSTDSSEDVDEETCGTERGVEETVYSLAGSDKVCTTRKRVISLDQGLESFVSSVTADTENKETTDAYDPSKVETV
ncbi:junctional protein associated with coronary artery disease isoform X1 [Scyliorhinus canicula]|uniref:junctional protein associated with coronary artery disease isoform X1 n=2 Tax=Scyliorhinus canicula TaxID=7830 RepID=UPI0018F5DAA1|nr:junctional protein associated with coronary artery disease isoform X1 [Scyliorhinus canicula]XP_038654169.1 junctional protein associated with coronary artery disease isoform X1 [Scyliorhinus canicula]XP_038654170.1 junctional protein associated with coronary artery disease isoform X1 [Scyliorhinus canicula]XP_038654171.1 junctional protein associated with coronary artery disease isoform X1 [Scyliorhinus canicula]XP_038654172.1 junctional protein associated with coronary artery disease isofo